ncbi:cbb3-type cytochrome c oxidase subunit 3 [Pseudotabrizicola sediminis]|uniref:Cbb3-type cytochrome c oxidase subunit 3 n=1 Tax=Pseudotabrizicola sediminis TaxID=2486418 RepID=A0ABY2KJ94_9RHOB|nr:cbb3-type cytochrome c oxidase subunit 3 [Pseudotabrizicola sediminis]TGD42471.1 cbb3-type cytochrome c oxidase subunit 3 [Pseudotabrizicola sediminis]
MTHETYVIIAKTFGLIYLMVFFLIVVFQTYRPSRRASADHAAQSILTAEDRPCP